MLGGRALPRSHAARGGWVVTRRRRHRGPAASPRCVPHHCQPPRLQIKRLQPLVSLRPELRQSRSQQRFGYSRHISGQHKILADEAVRPEAMSSEILAPSSPARHGDSNAREVAREMLARQNGRRNSKGAPDGAQGLSPRETAASLDTTEFLRRESSLDAVLQLGKGNGSPRSTRTQEADAVSMPSPSTIPGIERGGMGGESLSLDFLRRESSLEALRFITASPGKFGGPSRGVRSNRPPHPFVFAGSLCEFDPQPAPVASPHHVEKCVIPALALMLPVAEPHHSAAARNVATPWRAH